jgi:hypothetical protein
MATMIHRIHAASGCRRHAGLPSERRSSLKWLSGDWKPLVAPKEHKPEVIVAKHHAEIHQDSLVNVRGPLRVSGMRRRLDRLTGAVPIG